MEEKFCAISFGDNLFVWLMVGNYLSEKLNLSSCLFLLCALFWLIQGVFTGDKYFKILELFYDISIILFIMIC